MARDTVKARDRSRQHESKIAETYDRIIDSTSENIRKRKPTEHATNTHHAKKQRPLKRPDCRASQERLDHQTDFGVYGDDSEQLGDGDKRPSASVRTHRATAGNKDADEDGSATATSNARRLSDASLRSDLDVDALAEGWFESADTHVRDQTANRQLNAPQTSSKPWHSDQANIKASGLFMTADKRVPDKPAVVKQWIQDRHYNARRLINEEVPFPEAPKPTTQLDRTTHYRKLEYDSQNKYSVQLALKVVKKDMRTFEQDPRYFDPVGKFGQKDSLRMDEARAVRYELIVHLGVILRGEKAERDRQEQARKDAELDRSEARQAWLNENASRRVEDLLNAPPTPPSGRAKNDEEALERLKERAGKGAYALRDFDESRDQKKRDARKRDEEEDARRLEVVKGNKQNRIRHRDMRTVCRGCGERGHKVAECPQSANRSNDMLSIRATSTKEDMKRRDDRHNESRRERRSTQHNEGGEVGIQDRNTQQRAASVAKSRTRADQAQLDRRDPTSEYTSPATIKGSSARTNPAPKLNLDGHSKTTEPPPRTQNMSREHSFQNPARDEVRAAAPSGNGAANTEQAQSSD